MQNYSNTYNEMVVYNAVVMFRWMFEMDYGIRVISHRQAIYREEQKNLSWTPDRESMVQHTKNVIYVNERGYK